MMTAGGFPPPAQGGRSSVVEHLLPKQRAVGSNPIARSKQVIIAMVALSQFTNTE